MQRKRKNGKETHSFPQQGASLLELIIFIIILGLIGRYILSALVMAGRATPTFSQAQIALQYAESRAEIILAQKNVNGFASLTDPCITSPNLPICQVASGYTVSSSIANNWNGNTNYKVVTITVTGLGSASITELVADY